MYRIVSAKVFYLMWLGVVFLLFQLLSVMLMPQYADAGVFSFATGTTDGTIRGQINDGKGEGWNGWVDYFVPGDGYKKATSSMDWKVWYNGSLYSSSDFTITDFFGPGDNMARFVLFDLEVTVTVSLFNTDMNTLYIWFSAKNKGTGTIRDIRFYTIVDNDMYGDDKGNDTAWHCGTALCTGDLSHLATHALRAYQDYADYPEVAQTSVGETIHIDTLGNLDSTVRYSGDVKSGVRYDVGSLESGASATAGSIVIRYGYRLGF